MFKKPNRSKNIRRKIEVEDEESNTVEEVTIKKTVTSTEKKKKIIKKTVNALSFDDEEEGDEFQIKKSKASRKLKLNLPTDLDDPVETEESSNYSVEHLKSLRDNTPSLPSSVKLSLQSQKNDDDLLHEKFPSLNNTVPGIGIPDSSAILAAKKKREQMRKGFNITEADDGFISLNDMDGDDGDKAGSRLLREEDDINDDGEAEFDKYVGDKIDLNQSSAKQKKREKREELRGIIEEAEDDDDRSEDMERWEEDMMKFGGAKTSKSEYDPYSTPITYRPAQVPESSALPTLLDVLKVLNLSSNEVTENIQSSESYLNDSLKTIENAKITESDLNNEIERGSKRYNYFQELAQYTDDLGEFLDAKFPELEKLETKVHDIILKRTETVVPRRYQSNLDDLCAFTDLTKAKSDEEMGEESEVDEFGRVKELRNSESSKKRRREERLERIKRNADLADLAGEEATKEQSLWSDDDMTDEYWEEKDTTLANIQNNSIDDLTADVNESFKSLRAVMEKFETWKLEFYDDYEKAYGSLSLPGAFEFYIRCEMVSWDPFSDPLDFDSMRWHNILSEFGITPDREDPDVEMMNKVVEKFIIKRFRSLLDTLDVGSLKQMRNAAQTIEQISYYVDTEHKSYKELAIEIVDTLEKQITQFVDLIATAIPKSNLDQEAIEAKERFFWSQCKYLKTLIAWRRRLPSDQLGRLGSLITENLLLPILKPETYPNDLQLQNEALELLAQLKK